MMTTDDDARRSMRDAGVRERRKLMLDQPHVARLTAYVAGLREHGLAVPDFDPLDGGEDARVLFLFEKPGPMAVESGRGKRPGSGFISRNNDDSTAEATFNFMHQACIPRKLTVIWNVIPWWNGTVKVTGDERREGAARVVDLIGLLPKLRAVVMVGLNAAAQPYLTNVGLKLCTSDHPARKVRARWPDRWNAIPLVWAKAFAASSNGRDSESCTLHQG